MTENENTGENPQEITKDKIIDPKEYVEKEGEKTQVKPSPQQASPPEAPPQYKDHVVTKAVNKLIPVLINNIILKCQACEHVTETEMQETGLGEACAWFVDVKFPNIPTNTPTAAVITASLAVMGLTVSKHPKFKHLLESAEQQSAA